MSEERVFPSGSSDSALNAPNSTEVITVERHQGSVVEVGVVDTIRGDSEPQPGPSNTTPDVETKGKFFFHFSDSA